MADVDDATVDINDDDDVNDDDDDVNDDDAVVVDQLGNFETPKHKEAKKLIFSVPFVFP